jgi:hypothetical protein
MEDGSMALDARRRQKKAEKRNAKQKAKRKELAKRKAEGLGARLARAAAAPILHCCTTQSLWDRGMAQVLISRQLTTGQVAFATFLVDRYCLGVKDVFSGFMNRGEYFERLYDRIAARSEIVVLKPATARKLVEGAVEYARSLGLSPHSDYYNAHQIFGNIDPAECDREFEFGCDGKPLFIAGPYDSPGRCASILGILSQKCGTDGFDSLIHVPAGVLDKSGVLHLTRAFDDDEAEDYDSDDDGDDEVEDDVVEGSAFSTWLPWWKKS